MWITVDTPDYLLQCVIDSLGNKKMITSNGKTFCGICKKEVCRNQACISCTSCQNWVHLRCNDLTKKDLQKIEIQKFNCTVCTEVKKKSLSRKRKMVRSFLIKS